MANLFTSCHDISFSILKMTFITKVFGPKGLGKKILAESFSPKLEVLALIISNWTKEIFLKEIFLLVHQAIYM